MSNTISRAIILTISTIILNSPVQTQDFADPTSDVGFRKLFGPENKNTHIITAFLNDICGFKKEELITNISYENPTVIPDSHFDNLFVYEADTRRCGRKIVGLQIIHTANRFEERAADWVSSIYEQQDFMNALRMKDVVFVVVSDCDLFPGGGNKRRSPLTTRYLLDAETEDLDMESDSKCVFFEVPRCNVEEGGGRERRNLRAAGNGTALLESGGGFESEGRCEVEAVEDTGNGAVGSAGGWGVSEDSAGNEVAGSAREYDVSDNAAGNGGSPESGTGRDDFEYDMNDNVTGNEGGYDVSDNDPGNEVTGSVGEYDVSDNASGNEGLPESGTKRGDFEDDCNCEIDKEDAGKEVTGSAVKYDVSDNASANGDLSSETGNGDVESARKGETDSDDAENEVTESVVEYDVSDNATGNEDVNSAGKSEISGEDNGNKDSRRAKEYDDDDNAGGNGYFGSERSYVSDNTAGNGGSESEGECEVSESAAGTGYFESLGIYEIKANAAGNGAIGSVSEINFKERQMRIRRDLKDSGNGGLKNTGNSSVKSGSTDDLNKVGQNDTENMKKTNPKNAGDNESKNDGKSGGKEEINSKDAGEDDSENDGDSDEKNAGKKKIISKYARKKRRSEKKARKRNSKKNDTDIDAKSVGNADLNDTETNSGSKTPRKHNQRKVDFTTAVNKWCYLFKLATKTKRGELPEALYKDNLMMSAYKTLEKSKWENSELEAYEDNLHRIAEMKKEESTRLQRERDDRDLGRPKGKGRPQRKRS